MLLDKRLNAWRDNLADISLKNKVMSDNFIDAIIMQVNCHILPLRLHTGNDKNQSCQLIFGDKVKVFEVKNGWAWVQNCRDGYVGYCQISGLSPQAYQANMQVSALRTIIFSKPNIKIPPLDYLSMTSRLKVIDKYKNFSKIEFFKYDDNSKLILKDAWVFSKHICELDNFEDDFVATAKQFVNIPYLWGGNSSLGIDCSGLVQIALRRAGYDVLRDSDMQENNIGVQVNFTNDISILKYGDLIFWRGHVAIYCDNNMLLHANATDMMVSYAPFDYICSHILKVENKKITSVRRL